MADIDLDIDLNVEKAVASLGRVGEAAAGVFTGIQLARVFDSLTSSAADFFAETVIGAAEAEANLNRLNNAMRMAGTFSEAASQQMQEYAEQLQRTTTIEDDAAIGLLAFARNITRSNAEAIKLTDAAVDLGAALGTGPEAALQQLNMTLDGSVGRLGKQIPALKLYTEAQLRAGAAIDYVRARFGNAAEAEVKTYSGAIAQLSNVWGNLKETLGNFYTSSKSVIATIRELSLLISNMSTSLQQSFGGKDIFRDFIINMSVILQTATETARRIALSFELAFERVKAAYQGARVLLTLGLADYSNSELQKTMAEIDRIKASFEEESVATQFFDSLIQKISDTRNEITKLTMGDGTGGGIPDLAESFLQLGSGPVNSLTQAMNNFEIGFRMAAQNIAADARKAFQDQGATAFRTLASGITAGMAAIGRALVKGEDLFQAFAGALLNALGQALIAEGGARILQGLARAYGSYGLDPTAQGLIATGSAMTVAGGALSALGSGGSGVSLPSTDGGGGSAGIGIGSANPDFNAADKIVPGKQATVTVNIQGDVLDSRESGLRIVDLINEAFDTQGARVVTA